MIINSNTQFSMSIHNFLLKLCHLCDFVVSVLKKWIFPILTLQTNYLNYIGYRAVHNIIFRSKILENILIYISHIQFIQILDDLLWIQNLQLFQYFCELSSNLSSKSYLCVTSFPKFRITPTIRWLRFITNFDQHI